MKSVERGESDFYITCKGCGARHFFTGFQNNVYSRYDEDAETVFVLCTSDNCMYPYKYEADVKFATPNITPQRLESKILELEERILVLEQKTELPERGGVKQLKDETKANFTGLMGVGKPKEKPLDG